MAANFVRCNQNLIINDKFIKLMRKLDDETIQIVVANTEHVAVAGAGWTKGIAPDERRAGDTVFNCKGISTAVHLQTWLHVLPPAPEDSD